MKIGFLYEPTISYGIKNYQENLFSALEKIDLPVELIYYDDTDFIQKVNYKYKLKSLHFFSKLNKIQKSLYRILLPLELKRRYGILIYPYQFHPIINPYKIKIVSIVHDIIPYTYSKNFMIKFVYRYLLKKILKKSSKIIAISNVTKRDLVLKYELPPNKIKIINNGINDQFKFLNLKKKDYFLMFNRRESWKNSNFVINLLSRFNDIKLVIIGNKSEQKNNMTFIKNVSDEQLTYLYNTSLGLIFLSSYEGFGLPIIEAMKCGCPVLTLKTTNMPEEVTKYTIKLNKLNGEQLYRCLNELKNKTIWRNKIISDGIEYSRIFTWEKSALNLKSEIDSLLFN